MINLLENNVFQATKNITMQLTFVGTIAAVLTQACALFSRLIEVKFGIRFALLFASILYCIGMVSAGFASQVFSKLKAF